MEGTMIGDRTPPQLLTTLIGATFILIGIFGFIPGITTHLYGGLDFAGHNSQAKLLHVFQVSWLHNIVHIAFGLAGLALARTLELVGGCDVKWPSPCHSEARPPRNLGAIRLRRTTTALAGDAVTV